MRSTGVGTEKTDGNDARGIAQMMRMGWYRAVYVKEVETQRMRTLLANRRLLKRKLIDPGNHIRGALRAYGLRVGQVSRGKFEDRIRELIEHADYVFVGIESLGHADSDHRCRGLNTC